MGPRKKGFIFVSLIVVAAFLFSLPVMADDEFVTLTSMPVDLNLATAAIDGDDIFVVSGYNSVAGWVMDMYRYSISGDSWSTDTAYKVSQILAAIPTPRTEACNTGIIDSYGQFCVIGGNTGTGTTWVGPVDDVECYDPDTNTWTALDPLPAAVTGTSCTVHDGVIYVAAGTLGSTNYSDALYWLDTANLANGWQTDAGTRPVGSYGGGGALTMEANETGGEYRFSQFLGTSADSTHWGLDSETWSQASAFKDRIYPCVLSDSEFNTLIIGGGDFGTIQPYPTYDTLNSYDSVADEWNTASITLPISLAAMACVQDKHGYIYMFGGYSTDDKDKDIGLRLRAPRMHAHALNSFIVAGGYLYLSRLLGPFTYLYSYMLFSGSWSTPAPADLDDGDNGAARVPIPLNIPTGPAGITIMDPETGRSQFLKFTIQDPDDVPEDDRNVFAEDWDSLKIGLEFGLGLDEYNDSRWEADTTENAYMGIIKIQFKDKENRGLECQDMDEASAGEIYTPVFPITEGTFKYEWETYFMEGDGLSFGLYDTMGDSPNVGFFVDMIGGAVKLSDPATKAETDCNFATTTGQWYEFSFEHDLATGLGTLKVDGADTDCVDVATPFDTNAPVQGIGFILHDDITGGTTIIDNVTIQGFEESPPPVDDDDDTLDDDDSGDDDDDDDGAPTSSGDDDDDDGGCCG